jgi:hypothetical protein
MTYLESIPLSQHTQRISAYQFRFSGFYLFHNALTRIGPDRHTFGGKSLIPSKVLLDWRILGHLATFLREVQAMSAVNGDKARFNRQRRQKVARRVRNRELQKKLTEGRRPAPTSS